MSRLPSIASFCPAAVVATFLMLRGATAHADADYSAHPTQYRSILPPVTSTGCFLPVTKTRMLGLPKSQTDLWEAWVDARTPALIAGYEAYARSVRAYYAALEPAVRKAFPVTDFDRVEVLSTSPLVVAKLVTSAHSTWMLPKDDAQWDAFYRALLPKLGYPANFPIVRVNTQPPFTNGALCIGCVLDIRTDAADRILEVWNGFILPSAELNRAPKTTGAQAAAVLTELHPPAGPLRGFGAPRLAVIRDARGRGRLVWVAYVHEHCYGGGDTRSGNVAYAVDADSLAIVATIRATDLQEAIWAASPPTLDRE